MRKITTICFVVHVCFFAQSFAQIPTTVAVQIIRAEDERRYDKTLEDLMKMEARNFAFAPHSLLGASAMNERFLL
jgi:hypothetical protein